MSPLLQVHVHAIEYLWVPNFEWKLCHEICTYHTCTVHIYIHVHIYTCTVHTQLAFCSQCMPVIKYIWCYSASCWGHSEFEDVYLAICTCTYMHMQKYPILILMSTLSNIFLSQTEPTCFQTSLHVCLLIWHNVSLPCVSGRRHLITPNSKLWDDTVI